MLTEKWVRPADSGEPGTPVPGTKPPGKFALRRSPLHFLIVIVLAIFVSETIVMFLLDRLLPFSVWSHWFLDAALLVVLLFPILYYSVFRPLTLQVAERRRSEEELRENKTFLETIIESEPECVKLLGPDGALMGMNRAGLEMIEAESLEQVKGRCMYPLVAAEHREAFQSLAEAVFRGQPGSLEFQVVGLRGRRLWLETYAVPLRNEKNEVAALLGITRNVTERKYVEEALHASKERYRLLFDRSPVGIFNYDTQLRITDCNYRFVELLQTTREKLTGLDMNTLKDRSVLPCLLKAVEGAEGTYEGFYRATSGTAEIWVSMRTAPIFDKDESGKVLSCVGIVQDITERRKAEAKLKESESKYRKIFENLRDVFYQADLGGNLIEISPSILKYSGYAREELIGRQVLNFYYYPEDRTKLLEELNRKGEVADFEVRLKTKDDRLIYASVNAHFLLDEAGRPTGMEGSLRDVTERKKLEKQLLQSQKMEAVGHLAGGVAHDFNNILTAISGYGSLMAGKIPASDPLHVYLDEILASAERAASLTQSLLAFSRKQVIDLKPVNLNDIVLGMKKILERIISEDIEIEVVTGDRDLIVKADKSQIEQALINLATNARDAMPNGGRLTITTGESEIDRRFIQVHGYGEEGYYAVLSVTDTGVGMDKATREQIFEPFFTTKEVGKGTGLGLSTVYGAVKQHEGFINVCSEPGEGATFRVYLPLAKSSAPVAEEESATAVPSGNETVLLVEDDESARKVTRLFLEEFGYDVIEAVDGEDGLRRFAEDRERISLIISDVIMPKKKGHEMCDEARKIKPDIKVIFVSGYTSDVINNKTIPDRTMHFLQKPVAPVALLKKVREVLDT